MNEAKKKMRRRYGAEFKQQILSECAEPGASLARIALSHGINANVVHKWRRQTGGALPVMGAPSFVPVPLPPAHLLLGFIHGVHLNRWWTPSLPLRPIPSRVGWPRAYDQGSAPAVHQLGQPWPAHSGMETQPAVSTLHPSRLGAGTAYRLMGALSCLVRAAGRPGRTCAGGRCCCRQTSGCYGTGLRRTGPGLIQ